VRNTLNWLLIGGGLIMIIVEVILGAATGMDFALVGISMAAGGGIGLYFESWRVGMLATAVMAFIYLAFFRKYIRSKLSSPDRPSMTDALVGRTALVTARIADHAPGAVRVGDEVWRAALAPGAGGTREPGDSVVVDAVEGVTLNVR